MNAVFLLRFHSLQTELSLLPASCLPMLKLFQSITKIQIHFLWEQRSQTHWFRVSACHHRVDWHLW